MVNAKNVSQNRVWMGNRCQAGIQIAATRNISENIIGISRILRLIAVWCAKQHKEGVGCGTIWVLDLGLVLSFFLRQVPCPFHFTTSFSHD